MQKKTYRVKDLAEMLSMGESTIWKLCSDKNNNFPQPIKITSRLTLWKEEDIQAWLDNQNAKEKSCN
ncbi:MAG: AlpA family phage regulatory protein [Limnohabitans sp.]|nr:AlpA family phage regulatory protein [Limnohabitans sp.]